MKRYPPSTLDSIARRFWPKVDRRGPDECWRWMGSHNKEGRGQLWVGGDRQVDEVHRISLRLHGREVPDRWTTGLVVDHICKVIDCVNPAHLRIVSQVDNCGKLARPNPFYENTRKTHCVRGHPFAGDNLRIGKRGDRVCRACTKLRPSYIKRMAARFLAEEK